LVVRERTPELKVVMSGIIISTMPPVPLPKRACKHHSHTTLLSVACPAI
jgi:hypothetical protein